MNNLNKWMATMIAGAVAIVAFLFLPMISFMGQSVSLFDALKEAGDIGFKGLIVLLLIFGGSGLAVAGGWLKNKLYALAGSIGAAAGLAFFLIDGNAFDIIDYWGFGLWLALIAVIANVVFAVQLQKEEQ